MTDLNISIFKERRAKVASQMESNSILMLCSSNIVPRNNDTTFPFRQDSNFYYLTGFNELVETSQVIKVTVLPKWKCSIIISWDNI